MSIRQLAFVIYLADAEFIKLLWTLTEPQGQPFNAWFYPAFQQAPYTFWFHYHGLTWLAGPYSLLWYGLNLPAAAGYWVYNAYLLSLDLGLIIFLSRRSKLYALYFATISPWFTLIDPVDWFIIAMIFLARYRPFLLVLAPLTKLPVGAPLWVWSWVLINPNSLHGAENYGRYLILATIWSVSLFLVFYDRACLKKQKPHVQPVSPPTSTTSFPIGR